MIHKQKWSPIARSLLVCGAISVMSCVTGDKDSKGPDSSSNAANLNVSGVVKIDPQNHSRYDMSFITVQGTVPKNSNVMLRIIQGDRFEGFGGGNVDNKSLMFISGFPSIEDQPCILEVWLDVDGNLMPDAGELYSRLELDRFENLEKGTAFELLPKKAESAPVVTKASDQNKIADLPVILPKNKSNVLPNADVFCERKDVFGFDLKSLIWEQTLWFYPDIPLEDLEIAFGGKPINTWVSDGAVGTTYQWSDIMAPRRIEWVA